jgi:transposase
MINKCNIERIRQEEDVRFIGALSRNQMQELCDKQAIQLDLFDEKNICEVTDQDNPLIRYCLCKNPLNAQRDEETRERLVFLTQEALKKISDYKQNTTVEKLGARVGKALDKYKVGKLFNWCVIADEELAGNETKSTNHKLVWELNEDRIEREKRLDGCYTITTDVAKSELSAEETVSYYRKLAFVEKAFCNLKTASLNIRPIYHRKDERIKSHVFLCMLAYYVQWHLQERMREFLEINNKNGNQRKYTLEYIIETLKSITRLRVSIKGAEFYQVTKSNDLQSAILQCLGVQFSHADTNL